LREERKTKTKTKTNMDEARCQKKLREEMETQPNADEHGKQGAEKKKNPRENWK
jgi:hypothetical protein